MERMMREKLAQAHQAVSKKYTKTLIIKCKSLNALLLFSKLK